jgi:hypothetical protein
MKEGQLEVTGDHDAAMQVLRGLMLFEPSNGKETP